MLNTNMQNPFANLMFFLSILKRWIAHILRHFGLRIAANSLEPEKNRNAKEGSKSMWRRDFDQGRGADWPSGGNEEWDREKWDREHWDRWMDTVRSNQRDPDESYGSLGGTPYQGGVFSSGTYGGGAEYYSVTGMYENPLLEKGGGLHQGKGPKGYQRSDERIHDELCERLTRHPLIDASLMNVHVEKGEVTLTGEVMDRRMRHMAEDVADEVRGVKEIHNNLRVTRERAA
jgi:osmotically-inducible protein OsmY